MSLRVLPVLLLLSASSCIGYASATDDELTERPREPGPATPSDSGVDAGVVVPPTPDAGGTTTPPPVDAGVATPPQVDAGTPQPCGTLDTRVRTVNVSVSPASIDVGSSYGWSNNRPIHFSPLSDGRARIAWSSSDGKIHVTPVNAALQREAVDTVIEGVSVRGFVAHDDGSMALLVVRGTTMNFVKLRADGSVAVEKVLVGDPPGETTAGARWVDNWGHDGRLVFTGTNYVAYFGHTKFWGAMGKHQGDILMTLDANGNPAGGVGWDWGCSHSLDVRLATSGTSVAPVCLSDCYRAKGVLLEQNTVLVDEPSGNCAGSSDGELGGLVGLPGGGFALTFSSREGRTSRDVGFIRLLANGSAAPKVWLTTMTGDESSPTLARYGATALFSAWREGGASKAAVLSLDGAVLEGPVTLAASWEQRTDFATWPSGHVGWASGRGTTLEITSVRACSP